MAWRCFYPVDEDPFVHVAPDFGREHVLIELECWCHPVADAYQPIMVVHNAEH